MKHKYRQIYMWCYWYFNLPASLLTWGVRYLILNNELSRKIKLEYLSKFKKNPQYVLIIGFARSGTTLIYNILNSSSDAYITGEFNIHRAPSGELFQAYIENFNSRRLSELNGSKNKGSYIPKYIFSNEGLDKKNRGYKSLFNEFSKKYKIVGDKVAVGLYDYDNLSDLELAKNLIVNSEDVNLLIPLRLPSENIASIQKMFPNIGMPTIIKTFSDWNAFALKTHLTINSSRLIFHEDVSPPLVWELENLFATKISYPLSRIYGRPQRSDYNFPLGCSDYERNTIVEMDSIYYKLRNNFKAEKNILKSGKTLGDIPEIIKCFNIINEKYSL